MKKPYVQIVGSAVALATLQVAAVESTKTVGGKEYVYLTAADSSEATWNNSFYRGDNWSDGLAPHGDADYLVDLGKESRLQGFANFHSLVFAGRSLTLGNADTGAEGWASIADFRPCTISNLHAVAGGVAIGGSFTYLAGGNGRCYVLSTREVMDAGEDSVTVLGSFTTGNRASFCCRNGDTLLVGEYAYGKRYRTAEDHHLTTPAGEENPAVVMGFRLDEAEPLGVRESPSVAWSIPERIQGMSFSADGRVLLSASSVFGASQLYLYDLAGARAGQEGVFQAEDSAVPLYYLDSGHRTGTLHMPPKAEEIVFEGDRLYILFESASRRFQYGKLVGCDYVYSRTLPPAEEDT